METLGIENQILRIFELIFYGTGLLTWIIFIVYWVSRFLLGKGWIIKLVLGSNLTDSFKDFFNEFPNDLRKETIAVLASNLVLRLTRISVVGFIIAIFPTLLLIHQNFILTSQNDLFNVQNSKIESQNELVASQVKLLEKQNLALDTQNDLFSKQNISIESQTNILSDQESILNSQNELLKEQNHQVRLQNYLTEGSRRSGLSPLLNSVLEQINSEIIDQSRRHTSFVEDNTFVLSNSLIGRISALSQGLEPYRYLENDTLTSVPYSPERGQLFVSLMKLNLDSTTLKKIYETANFKMSDFRNSNFKGDQFYGSNLSESNFFRTILVKADLSFCYLNFANFNGAMLGDVNLFRAQSAGANFNYCTFLDANLELSNFRDSKFIRCFFNGANLSNANFVDCEFQICGFMNANFQGANLHNADLSFANFDNSKNLTFQQLLSVNSLFESVNLPPDLLEKLKKAKPCLFLENGCN